MAIILCIETATSVCSVALCDGPVFIAEENAAEKNSHSAVLTSLIEKVLADQGIGFRDLSAVAVSKGPGSYTGLRIGVSTAKGLCYGLGIPLLSVNTLESMARGFLSRHLRNYPDDDRLLLCPMLDAKRHEVYTAVFDRNCSLVRETSATIVVPESFGDLLNSYKIVFFGDGAAKCRDIISHPGASFDDSFVVSAGDMAYTVSGHLRDGILEDTAYFEPFYLKDFIAGLPHVKGLT